MLSLDILRNYLKKKKKREREREPSKIFWIFRRHIVLPNKINVKPTKINSIKNVRLCPLENQPCFSTWTNARWRKRENECKHKGSLTIREGHRIGPDCPDRRHASVLVCQKSKMKAKLG